MRITRATAAVSIVHLVANALLMLLGYYWLGLAESNAVHLAWSFLVIVTFVGTAIWLHGATFVYFDRERKRGLQDAAKLSFRHLPPLLTLTLIAVLIYVFLWHWRTSFAHTSFLIASYLTNTLRIPTTPTGVIRTFNSFLWFMRWVVLPVCLILVFA